MLVDRGRIVVDEGQTLRRARMCLNVATMTTKYKIQKKIYQRAMSRELFVGVSFCLPEEETCHSNV